MSLHVQTITRGSNPMEIWLMDDDVHIRKMTGDDVVNLLRTLKPLDSPSSAERTANAVERIAKAVERISLSR